MSWHIDDLIAAFQAESPSQSRSAWTLPEQPHQLDPRAGETRHHSGAYGAWKAPGQRNSPGMTRVSTRPHRHIAETLLSDQSKSKMLFLS
ncbi:hypothetical protein [Actinoplanes campanulatus]|uniref:hypothetical protein n=1 Tax=Actinoplanes campanulatus TaxID=113559 RepID=UPI0019548A53|nr:hypothetical protein [Actinoplanes capillaceus]